MPESNLYIPMPQSLTNYGQINKGDKLFFDNKWWEVKFIKDKGKDTEEVILNIRKNTYFITKLVLNGSSWAKHVYLYKNALATET